MLKVYTDASFKDGVSSHHYHVYNRGRKIKRRTFLNSVNESSVDAEAMTIIEALKFYDKKDEKRMIIHTDNMQLVKSVKMIINNVGNDEAVKFLKSESFKNEDVRYIVHLLKVTNSEIRWMSRNNIKIKVADRECRKMMKTKMRRV